MRNYKLVTEALGLTLGVRFNLLKIFKYPNVRALHENLNNVYISRR